MLRKLKVTMLASEWGSSNGGLSTMNRELAIQLAKRPKVDITLFVLRCSEQDKHAARSHNIKIVTATRWPGYKEIDWLSFPPEDLQIDIIVGHGEKVGHQAQVIRDAKKCKWVQVVHTDPEELGMFKNYPNPISRGEEKHNIEVELCEIANYVVGVGPKLSKAFRRYLRSCEKDQTVFDLTPGIFDEFKSVKQVREERTPHSILVFGRGDTEDFELKGFDIAGKAVAALPDCHLMFVGAPAEKCEDIAKWLTACGVPRTRLRVRGFVESRDSMKRLFCEVDLVLMPSRTEGFGLAGLEALSAGLPVLVSKNSGFGEALSKVSFGSSFVVNSEDHEVWAAAIKRILDKDRITRLKESSALRDSYQKKYSWNKQINDLLDKMTNLVRGNTAVVSDKKVQMTAAKDDLPPDLERPFQYVLSTKSSIRNEALMDHIPGNTAVVYKFEAGVQGTAAKDTKEEPPCSLNKEDLLDHIRGTIYGNCIGDAIGLLTEFMTKKEATHIYGNYHEKHLFQKAKEMLPGHKLPELEYSMKYRDLHRERWHTGDWTDDSDQMILILLSLVANNGKMDRVDYAKRLKKWSKEGFKELGDYGGMGIGSTTHSVLRHPEFLTDPHKAATDVWECSGRYLAPNGGVMRTSILGIHDFSNIDEVMANTTNACKVTHADPRCIASCVAVTTAVAIMLQGKHVKKSKGKYDVDAVINEAYEYASITLESEPEKEELKKYMFAKSLDDLQLDENGKIGYTYKCMGAGFWSLRQDNFRAALEAITYEGGDADTNGAVAGALLGCKLGASALPPTWLNGLKHKEWLDKHIDSFLTLLGLNE